MTVFQRSGVSYLVFLLLGLCAGCANSQGVFVAGGKDVQSCRMERITTDLFTDHETGILVAAHRGLHTREPENALSSIEAAIAASADIVELDVRLSKDRAPVLMHDETLERTTDGSGPVARRTLSQLKVLRLRNARGDLTDEKIPTLAEALSVARGRVFINVDLKTTDVEPVLSVIKEADMIGEVMFYTSSLSVRARVLEAAPDAIAMPIARAREDVERLIEAFDLDLLHLRESYNSSELAALLDDRQVAGWTNALGSADDLVRLNGAEAGFGPIVRNRPDVIQTDFPEELLRYLKSRGVHWSSQQSQACGAPKKKPALN